MKNLHPKYLFYALTIILAVLAFLIIKPFITPILTSIVLAYLFYPLYKILNKKINSTLSSLLILFIAIILFVLPLSFIFESLFRESVTIYNSVKNISLDPFLENILNQVFKYISSQAESLIKTIPRFLINAFVTLFLFYYFLKEGESIISSIKKLIPLDKSHKEILFREFKRVTSAVVYGLILIGLIVGFFTTIGFYIFKVPNPVLWGLIVLVFSILPGVGASIIWIPASLIKIYQGDYFNGIGLFIFGFIFISGVEVLFKPRLISHKSDIHPAIVVLGVFGGLALLGFIGLFFGPLILVVFITLFKHLFHKKD